MTKNTYHLFLYLMLVSSYAGAQTAVPGPAASLDTSGTYTVDAGTTYKPTGGAFADGGPNTDIIINVVNGDTLNMTTGSLTLLDAYGDTNFPLQGGSVEFNGHINAVATSAWPSVTYFNSNHGGHLTINGDVTLSATNTGGRLTTLIAAEADNAKTIVNGNVQLSAAATYALGNVMKLTGVQATSLNQNGALSGDNTYLSIGRQGENDTIVMQDMHTTNTFSGTNGAAQTLGFEANGYSAPNNANVPVKMDVYGAAELKDFTASGFDSAVVWGALASGEGTLNFHKAVSMQNFHATTTDVSGLSEAYGVKADENGVINFYAPVVIQDIVSENAGGGAYAFATGAETGNGGVLNFYSDVTIKNIVATGATDNYPYAFYAADGGIINVNPSNNPNSIIQIEGAVQAGGATSEINLNLTNKDSYFRGIEDIVPSPYNGQFNLTLSNGASWQLDGGDYVSGTGPYEVLGFTSNGGVFDTGSWSFGDDIAAASLTFKNVTIDSVDGTSTTFALRTDLNNSDGDFIHVTNLNTPTNYLKIYDVAMWQEQTANANEVHVLTADNGVGSLSALEVDSMNSLYKYTPQLDIRNNNQDVYVTGFTEGQTSTVATVFLDAGTAAFTSWRADSKLLRQRMGTLRTAENQTYGGWARTYKGEFKYNGSSASFKNKSTGADAGFDLYRAGDAFNQVTGFVVGYRDTDFKYPIGKGDGDTYSLSLYNTIYTDGGIYLDTVLKGSYLDNDIKYASNGDYVKGSYDTYGIQLQLEAGKRQDVNNVLFVEPFVMANVGHLSGQDYTTNNGIKIKHEGAETFVGGVGLYIGSDFILSGKTNTFYVKGVGKKEFLGTTKTKMFSAAGEYLYHKDKFDDAWLEYGMGYAVAVQDNIRLFADVERSADADYKMPWQVNLGVRVDF